MAARRMNPGIDAAMERVLSELDSACEKFGDFNSTHEALGVLIEELRELEDAIRENSLVSVADEAMQVSAVALRLFEVCERAVVGDAPEFKKRSGA